MKFDHARNSKEMSQLLDYVTCLAISCGIATVLGISWLVVFAIVVLAFKSWKKTHPFLSIRLQVLTIVACCLLSLVGNWSAYCDGVSAGYDAAAGIGKGRANQSPQHNASTMSSSTIKSAVRHG
jgi:hypothetical protein